MAFMRSGVRSPSAPPILQIPGRPLWTPFICWSSRSPPRNRYHWLSHFLFDEDFFFDEDFLLGTLPPAFLASDSPMAIACFLLVTFFPERPLFRVPSLRSCIAFSTLSEAFLPYLAIVSPSDFCSGQL